MNAVCGLDNPHNRGRLVVPRRWSHTHLGVNPPLSQGEASPCPKRPLGKWIKAAYDLAPMRRCLIVIGIAALLATTTAAAAAALWKPPYRTDHQAELFLERGLKTWAGINLRAADFKSAFCVNGYYSKREQRTKRHYPQGHVNRVGENTFRSFACTLSVNDRSFHVYVVTTMTLIGWRVMADR
jgi:hypothetical protein